MQEFSVPVAYVVQPDDNITDDVVRNAESWPDAVGLKQRTNGSWTPVTWREFAAEVRECRELGPRRGDQLGVIVCLCHNGHGTRVTENPLDLLE